MRTGERSPCHSDGTDKNADQTIEKWNNYFITQSNITVTHCKIVPERASYMDSHMSN